VQSAPANTGAAAPRGGWEARREFRFHPLDRAHLIIEAGQRPWIELTRRRHVSGA